MPVWLGNKMPREVERLKLRPVEYIKSLYYTVDEQELLSGASWTPEQLQNIRATQAKAAERMESSLLNSFYSSLSKSLQQEKIMGTELKLGDKFTIGKAMTPQPQPPQELVIKRVSNGFTVATPPSAEYGQREPRIFAVAETVDSLVAQLRKWGKAHV